VIRVGVVGASGYSGAVAARLVESHPRLCLAFATSDRLAGESVAAHLGLSVRSDARFVPNAAALDHADACDAVLLASAMRRTDILRELVALGVEDAQAHPEMSLVAYQNATREARVMVQ